MVPNPIKFMGFGAMDVTKPYKFIGFGASPSFASSQTELGAESKNSQ